MSILAHTQIRERRAHVKKERDYRSFEAKSPSQSKSGDKGPIAFDICFPKIIE